MFLQFLNTLILVSLLTTGNLALIDFFNYNANIIPDNNVNLAPAPKRIENNSLGIKTTASSIMIIDEVSQAVLFEKNSQQQSSIASLTKLMTAIVFLEHNPGWDKRVMIKETDQKNGGIIYLLAGEVVTVEDLFYLTLVSSTNEAVSALVRSTGIKDNDFVNLMNQKTQELNLKATEFFDPTGLDPNNKSTVSDLVKLAKEAFGHNEIRQASKLTGYQFEVLNKGIFRYALSTNQLLNSFINQKTYSIEGAKTGYLDEAGYCQIIKVSNDNNGKSIIIAILNSQTIDDRWQEIKGLADWVFTNYSWN